MSISPAEANSAATHAIKVLVDNFNYQLQAKDAVKKLPRHVFEQINNDMNQTLFIGNLPRPSWKCQQIREDVMLAEPGEETALTACVPAFSRQKWESWQNNSQSLYDQRRLTSRYASSDVNRKNKHVKLHLSSIKPTGIVHISPRSQQATAKSFRSAIELDDQIRVMRRTYLNQMREQAKLMNMTQQIPSSKKRRIPKDYTFDTTGQLLERHPFSSKKTTSAPLKAKSVSVQKITKKLKKEGNTHPEEDNIQDVLQRAATKTGERNKRLYQNGQKRQISHMPFISLTEDAKLVENTTVMNGPKSPKDKQTKRSKMHSTFTHYFREQPEDRMPLLSEQMLAFPNTYKPSRGHKKGYQEFNLKNSMFMGKDNIEVQKYIDFNPVNVTRDHGIDQFYRVKRSTQLNQE